LHRGGPRCAPPLLPTFPVTPRARVYPTTIPAPSEPSTVQLQSIPVTAPTLPLAVPAGTAARVNALSNVAWSVVTWRPRTSIRATDITNVFDERRDITGRDSEIAHRHRSRRHGKERSARKSGGDYQARTQNFHDEPSVRPSTHPSARGRCTKSSGPSALGLRGAGTHDSDGRHSSGLLSARGERPRRGHAAHKGHQTAPSRPVPQTG
jgi:hypothetical protein